MTDIREIRVYRVANGFTLDIRKTVDGNPWHSETRIAPDLATVKAMLDELLA